MHRLLIIPATSLTQEPFTPFPSICLHSRYSRSHPQSPKNRAKIHADQVLQGFEVVLIHHLFAEHLTNLTHPAWKRADFQLHRAAFHMIVRDQTVTFSTTTEKRGHDVHILTVVDHSKTSKRTCLHISRRDPKNVLSPIVPTIIRALPVNTTKTDTL